MAARLSGRESDEVTLAALALRHRGMSARGAALALGMNAGNVIQRTEAVRVADLAHPDARATPEQIAGAYW